MLSRRQALKGTVAALTAAATNTAALAVDNPDTALLALCGQYDALTDKAKTLDRQATGKPKHVYNAIYDRVADIYDEASEVAERMAALDARTAAGLVAKLRIVRIEAGFHPDQRMTQSSRPEKRAVAVGLWTAMEDVERLAGRAMS